MKESRRSVNELLRWSGLQCRQSKNAAKPAGIQTIARKQPFHHLFASSVKLS